MDDDVKKIVRKHALDNARKHDGSPNMGSVIGKLLSERPELKSQLGSLTKDINNICADVSKLSVEEQTSELEKSAPELLEKRAVEEKKLKPLPNAEKGKVVMRLAPSPSGPMHIGHVVGFSLSHLYCKEYDGKLILRIEDTNPENIYEPAYKMIEEDARWFTENNIHDVVVQSSRLQTYYDYAESLISKGRAYVCLCSADLFRNLSLKKKECPCRSQNSKEQLLRWDKMFVEYEPGQAVVRIKTDINHPNPAMRDWPALRINHNVHPRTGEKFKVWPLMNFSVAIDDHELGVTHTIRGKDHVDNEKRQKYIFDYFGWTPPSHSYIGKINFEGMKIKTSVVKKEIEYGQFDGWDDIRLPFLAALRRRGFMPKAFQMFAMDIGLGLNDKVVPAVEFFKSLNAHNRKLIDPVVNRYFFVWDPVKLSIKGAPVQDVSIPLHPDDKARGRRDFKAGSEFIVSKSDFDNIKPNNIYRLMDCLNFKDLTFDSTDLSVYRDKGSATLHWLPADSDKVDVEVLMPDRSVKKGVGEIGLKSLAEGTLVQFERFGFVRLDKKGADKLTFWFAHK